VAVLPDRQIALMRIPRLAVSFRFEGVDAAHRARFMRTDLHTQRGGGERWPGMPWSFGCFRGPTGDRG
jgi:hypothetical protein